MFGAIEHRHPSPGHIAALEPLVSGMLAELDSLRRNRDSVPGALATLAEGQASMAAALRSAVLPLSSAALPLPTLQSS